MRSFTTTYLENLVVTPRMVRLLTKISELRGKQALWAQTKPEVLNALKQVAMIESVESSSRMENVQVGPQTFDRIVVEAGDPEGQDRSQTELAGYRDALDMIHKNAADISISENAVRQLHQTLMQYTPTGGGDYKRSPNDIVERGYDGQIVRIRFETVSPALTTIAMQSLHERMNSELNNAEFEPLLLLPLYVHDFLCIHPFSDGNGRIARLLTVLFLDQQGYDVGRYISLERLIEASKAIYYDSLAAADVGWHNGAHNHVPFTEYLLGVILLAYRNLEESTAIDLDYGARSRMVERAIEGLSVQFRLADVIERCPLVNRDTIRGAMAKMQAEGKIKSEGKGRNASWQRLNSDISN